MYYVLEEATRGAIYINSIQPSKNQKDRQNAFLTLVNQYVRKDKWDLVLKVQNNILVTRRWNGRNSNHPLELFIQ